VFGEQFQEGHSKVTYPDSDAIQWVMESINILHGPWPVLR